MSQPGPSFQLAQLDEYRPATLDPAIWSANLVALSAEQPELAEQLRHAVLPATWRPALALDGSYTYRLEEPGYPPAWLGDTAAPQTRTGSLLGKFDPAGRNPALPCCGAGAELRLLLDKLPLHLAVFVFETDLRVLAANLRVQDLSAAIHQGRCVLVPPGEETAFLIELLERLPGLLPPGDILLPNSVPPGRLQELRAICEHVMSETTLRRNILLQELDASMRPSSAGPSTSAALGGPALLGAQPRLAVLSLTAHAPTHVVAASLERAARRLGWSAVCRAVADPRSVHGLAHAQVLVAFAPNLTICVNHPPASLPLTLPGTTCVWVLDEAAAALARADDDTLYLAASPRVAAVLGRAQIQAPRLLNWYWACEDPVAEASAAQAEPAVILVADLPDCRPETYGVEQATHKALWERARAAVAQVWETPRILEPEKLLARAERDGRVELTDPTLRQTLVRLIEQVLIPAGVLEQIAAVLASAPITVWTLGRGWERIEAGNFKPLAGAVSELPAQGRELYPRAAIFVGGRDPLSAAFLHAAARGWPLLLHTPGGRSLVPDLGGVLQPGQHFEPFSDLAGLRRTLELMRERPEAIRRRLERTRRHVAEHHSYARRLQDLWAYVQKRPSRGLR